jgi:hypothetical protein
MRSSTLVLAVSAGLGIACLVSVIMAHFRFSRGILPLASNFRQLQNAAKVTTQPRYRRIRLKTDEDLDRSYPLVMDYLNQPDLASSVQELVLDRPIPRPFYPDEGDCGEVATESEHDQDENLIIDAVKRLGLGTENEQHIRDALIWKKWKLNTMRPDLPPDTSIEYFRQNAEYAQSVSPLLLSQCPSVQRLKVNKIGSPLREFLTRANYGMLPQTHLENLRHVKFALDDTSPLYGERFYAGFDILDYLRLIHRLPAIESVSIDGISEDPNGRTALPPHTSNLKKIHIGHSDLASMILASIIRLPKALEEFSFSIGGRATQDGGFALMFPKTLGKAILCQRSSLTLLDLDVDDYLHVPPGGGEQEDVGDEYYPEWEEEQLSWQRDDYWKMDEAESKGPIWTKDLPDTRVYGTTMGSLQDFTALTHLTIGVKLLLGVEGPAPFRLVDALPPSLKFLCIRGYKAGENPAFASQIQELMEKKAEKLPNLKEVEGVESEIPSSKTIERRNGDYEHLLWREEDQDDRWLES